MALPHIHFNFQALPELLLAIVAFVILSAMQAIAGGWFWIARKYSRPNKLQPTTKFNLELMYIGPFVRYAPLNVGSDPGGLCLSLPPPFGLFCKPLMIPWTDLEPTDVGFMGWSRRKSYRLGLYTLGFSMAVAALIDAHLRIHDN